jgi:hypothetical protein
MKEYLCSLFLVFGLVVGTCAPAQAEEAVIVGDDPDGNAPVTDITLQWDSQSGIAGFNVYYGRVSGDYSRIVTVGSPTATIGIRGTKTVYFAVTAFTADGTESDLSGEISWP